MVSFEADQKEVPQERIFSAAGHRFRKRGYNQLPVIWSTPRQKRAAMTRTKGMRRGRQSQTSSA